MRVLVAGATGVIGRPLVSRLVERGHDVTGITRSERGAEQIRAAGAEAALCDAFDSARVRRAMEQARPEVVVNELTSIPADFNPRKMKAQFELNDRLRRDGTRNLARAATETGVGRLMSQSIAFAYKPEGDRVKSETDPLDVDVAGPFRRTVRSIAELERLTLGTPGVDGTVLRYGWIYGPGTGFAEDGALAAMVRGGKFPVGGGGEGVWSFVHAEDVASATALAVERNVTGVFNVVDDEPAPLKEWLPRYAEAVGGPQPRRVPALLVRLAAGRVSQAQMTTQRGASNRAAREALGWTPSRASWREGFAEAG